MCLNQIVTLHYSAMSRAPDRELAVHSCDIKCLSLPNWVTATILGHPKYTLYSSLLNPTPKKDIPNLKIKCIVLVFYTLLKLSACGLCPPKSSLKLCSTTFIVIYRSFSNLIPLHFILVKQVLQVWLGQKL